MISLLTLFGHQRKNALSLHLKYWGRSYYSSNVDNIINICAQVFTACSPLQKMNYLLMNREKKNEIDNPSSTLIERIRNMNYPARPDRPLLVDKMKNIPSPKESGTSHSIYMLHNCAHIELNAVDVCSHTILLPSLLNEKPMPDEFYSDFFSIAKDEARHFGMLQDRLSELGASYGDLPSHKVLWENAAKTGNSLTARVAMCQLINEGRGLDSGPRLVHKLSSVGDRKSANIMKQIVYEEVNHVKLGIKWFVWICEREKRDPKTTYQHIVLQYCGSLPTPFNYEAREQAGFPKDWYEPMKRTFESTAA
jgi:uncharacterized ferritin-like protein (DUF455 family)